MKELIVFLLAMLPWSGVGEDVVTPDPHPAHGTAAPAAGGGPPLPCDGVPISLSMDPATYSGSGGSEAAAVRDAVGKMQAAMLAHAQSLGVGCAKDCPPPQGCELRVGANGNYVVIPWTVGPPTWEVFVQFNGHYSARCTACP